MKEGIYSKLKALLREDKIQDVKSEIDMLFKEYNVAFEESKRQMLEAFTSDGDNPNDFEMPLDEFDRKIEDLKQSYATRLKALEEQRKNEERTNLEIKRNLLVEFKELIESEEKINLAFEKYNELKERWDSVARVPAHTVKELQEEFRHLNEQFFYNIRIYRELLQHDFKKNLEAKNDLVARMNSLFKIDNIKEVETLHKAFQMEWDQIGPTFKEDWEEVKNKFYDTTHRIQARIKDHYQKVRDSYKQNLEKKEAIVDEVKAILEQKFESLSDWKKGEKKIEELRGEWKKIGFATKGKNDEVWNNFREVTQQFFQNRKEFFGELKDVQKEASSAKLKLIEEAKRLAQIPDNKESFDWRGRTSDFVNLQRKWKEAGNSFRGEEQKLWKIFRKECDGFFKMRDEFWAGAAEREKANAALKKELIETVAKWKKTEDLEANKTALLHFDNQWKEIGFVPKNQISKLEDGYKKAIAQAWESLGLDSNEREKIKFENKIENLQSNNNAEKSLKYELRAISEAISKQKEMKLQLENNLGFFSGKTSKANPLMTNVLTELENVTSKIEELQEKKKLLNVAIRSLEKEQEAEVETENNIEEK
ncbi:MAG: DUF349 domain-containing protein [Flavobacteriales bacterium]|nr:DUF349 domain-containing protein [Flavobacteriales bacterium]